ncbi:hypothetical protein V1512DRAFT_288405 [Lipomyces arxii]|uniref:uncharacterized protein n=1 Tax=Lipomyces arxii TaxID=56418 RepID=UPI0034CD43F2
MRKFQKLLIRLPALFQASRRTIFTGRKQLNINDPEFVTLDRESEKDRDVVFKYNWGSWVRNDSIEKRKRYTPFKLSGVSEVVKRARDQASDLRVESLVSLAEGKHHRIFLVDMNDGAQYILRIPYPLDYSKAARRARVQSEVATMDFMRKKRNMLIPEIISWSPTADNPLEREYILMEYIAPDSKGRQMETLMQKWDPITEDVHQRGAVLRVIVDLLDDVLSTKFNAFGSLYFTEDVCPELQNNLPYENETDKELVDRWRIGPTVEKKFWQPGINQIDSVDRGPWYTPADYLAATANAHVTAYTNLLKDRFSVSPELYSKLPQWRKAYEQYAKLAPRLIPDSVPPDAPILAPVLWHPDIDPLNILVNSQNELTNSDAPFTSAYLLDWEGACIKPYMFHGAPKFIEYTGQKIYNIDDVEGFNAFSDRVKALVLYMVASTLNEYTFEHLINKELPTLINAYSPNAKLLREPYKAAMRTDYHFEPQEIVQFESALLKTQINWPELTAHGLISPVDYTEDEAARIENERKEFEERVTTEIPFYSTKGWAPQNVFEDAVNKGEIVRIEGGDYILKSAEKK